MKKYLLLLSLLGTSLSLFGATGNNSSNQTMQMQPADCSNMSADEQSFANQLMDSNNKMLFCSQFTPQQRQQAMQMNGAKNASGNAMNADDAVQQVMQTSSTSPMAPAKGRTGGACPVR
jgi:hypothetical protein